MPLTQHERRQRMDERNRLRRMNAVALSDSIPVHQIRRLLLRDLVIELTDRVERRIAELNAELGFES